MKPSILAAAALALASGSAVASSPAAWAQEERDAARACVAASGLSLARVTGRPAMFDDTLALDGLLVSGREKQRWVHGKLVTKLCLYDRRRRRAHAVDAPGWPAPLR